MTQKKLEVLAQLEEIKMMMRSLSERATKAIDEIDCIIDEKVDENMTEESYDTLYNDVADIANEVKDILFI